MSRVGKELIILPAGVSLTFNNGIVTVTGSKGTLSREIKPQISVVVEGNEVTLTRRDDKRDSKSYHGLYNRLVANMVKGVSEGFTRELVLNGVGYKAAVNGKELTLNVGFSHPVKITADEGLSIRILTPQEMQGTVPATLGLAVSGIDKEKVGSLASKIRAVRKVEPYHLYGIRYRDEVVIKKESKSGAKGAKKK